MSVEKKSLINNMTATKKAIIASNTTVSPVATSKGSAHLSKGSAHLSKGSAHLSKGAKLSKFI